MWIAVLLLRIHLGAPRVDMDSATYSVLKVSPPFAHFTIRNTKIAGRTISLSQAILRNEVSVFKNSSTPNDTTDVYNQVLE